MGELRTVHVMTLPPGLQIGVLDGVLSAVEVALIDLGASNVWVAPDRPALTVMADLPDGVLTALRCGAEDGAEDGAK